jgi:hypothetical protein
VLKLISDFIIIHENSITFTVFDSHSDIQIFFLTTFVHKILDYDYQRKPIQLSKTALLHVRKNYINTLRTGRRFIDFWLLNVADQLSFYRLFGDTMFQSTIHCSEHFVSAHYRSQMSCLAVSKHDLTVLVSDSFRMCLCS